MVQLKTREQQEKALGLMKGSNICSDPDVYGAEGVWIAWWDQPKEGQWV